MDEKDMELHYEELDEEPQTEADPEAFYWALKAALARPVVEVTPASF